MEPILSSIEELAGIIYEQFTIQWFIYMCKPAVRCPLAPTN
jgi:hypothetical protein